MDYIPNADFDSRRPDPFAEWKNPENRCDAALAYPWRRYFARGLDASLYGLFLVALMALVFRVDLTQWGGFAGLFILIFSTLLMLFVEPLLLSRFGSTPGKWIFGLTLRLKNGKKLDYGEALSRTWGIIFRGYGFQLPIFDLVRLVISYQRCTDGEALPWDEGRPHSYTLRDEKAYRIALYLLASLLTFGLTVGAGLLGVHLASTPPNEGPLTISEFAENYNHLLRYQNGLSALDQFQLNQEGQWQEPNDPASGVFYLEISPRMTLSYTTDDGVITTLEASFLVENQELMEFPGTKLLFLAQAFTASGRLTPGLEGFLLHLQAAPDQDYTTQIGDAALTYQAENRGYLISSTGMFGQEEGTQGYFAFTLTLTYAPGLKRSF